MFTFNGINHDITYTNNMHAAIAIALFKIIHRKPLTAAFI